jgi:uncharacterized protein
MRKDDLDIPEVFRRAMEEAGWQMDQEGEGGSGDRPPRRPIPPPSRPSGINRTLIIASLVLLFIFSLGGIATFYTDWLWFEHLGYRDMFVTRLVVRWSVFGVAFAVAAAILLGNWVLARKRAMRESSPIGPNLLGLPGVRWLVVLAGLLLTFLFASAAAAQWESILLFINAESFGRADPIFGQDVGFYIFQLPIFEFIQGWLLSVLLITLLGLIPIYAANNFADIQRGAWQPFRSVNFRRHIALVGGFLLLIWAGGYLLDMVKLVFSPRGVAFGASYVDLTAGIWALRLQLLFMLLTALGLFYNFFRPNLRLPAITGALWLVSTFVIGGLVPGLLQRYVVEPNELSLEAPYIDYNIEFTRAAYALDQIETRDFGPVTSLSPENILDNEDVLRNIRLWDYRPLRQTYQQLQALRPYYEFNDVDIDRYLIDGKQQQVMLSARELDKNRLPAPSWVNRNLEFTHGYGIIMNAVNEITPEGQPDFFIKDLPPESRVPIEVTQPEIYFGELTNDTVYVSSGREEFSYPSGDENIYTSYAGTGGVLLDSYLKRIAFSLRQSDPNVLLSTDITDTTRIQYRRQIQERVRELTPFLVLDVDPYIVIDEAGRLMWIQDAFTVSDNYPYSTPTRLTVQSNVAATNVPATTRVVNYMRNPVKVVIDAYNGSVTYYVSDPDDPILRSYSRAFPGVFQPIEDMSEDLRRHVRYPVDYFSVQARQYLTYHMTDTRVFYNKENLWQIPTELIQNTPREMEPYYVTMPLPGNPDRLQEYLLILPVTPANRNNMIAWMAARNDPDNYGELIVYELPRQELIFGPTQVQGRINQDTTISQQFSLWDQRGSQVIRGNLLVLPISQSFLYLQPIFLVSETNALPELKRIVTASNTNVAMDETLAGSLVGLARSGGLASTETEPIPPPETGDTAGEPVPTPAPPAFTGSVEDLIQLANAQFLAAQQAQRDGDWARYGQELDALQQTLDQLLLLSGSPE